MPDGSNCVALVVDREFGPRLAEWVPRMPVWICVTPSNRPWIERMWAEEAGTVTSFRVNDEDGPEKLALDRLADLDLHHGDHGQDPRWSRIEFYGVRATEPLREALAAYGATQIEPTPEGFVASRPKRA